MRPQSGWQPKLGSHLKAQTGEGPIYKLTLTIAEFSFSRDVGVRASVSHWQSARGHPWFLNLWVSQDTFSVNKRGHSMFVIFKERLSQKSPDRLPLGSHLSAWGHVPVFTLQRKLGKYVWGPGILPLVGGKSLPAREGKQRVGVGNLLLRKQYGSISIGSRIYRRHMW